MNKLKLYTTHCPKCEVLKEKLDGKHLQYEEITDVTAMADLGIDQVPVLQIDDGPLMGFMDSVKYINQLEVVK